MDQMLNTQKALFEQIKQKVSPSLTLVHEVSEVLGLSYDSTYRRIRGDQFLSFDELLKLSEHYGLSIDQLCFKNDSNKVITFDAFLLEPGKYRFKDWINLVLRDMTKIKESKEKKITYSAKDPPIYHYFIIPEIISFKAFLWEKTVYQFPELKEERFSFDYLDADTLAKGEQISRLATKIPTVELWNDDTILLALKQIEYYWVAGLFEKKDDVFNLLDKVEKWILHIKKQAEYGFKFLYNDVPEGIENSYILYETEVVHNDNIILVELGDSISTYIAVNSLNLLRTTNRYYCENVKNYINSIILRSNLISQSGEKERNRLFNKHLYLLEELRKRIP